MVMYDDNILYPECSALCNVYVRYECYMLCLITISVMKDMKITFPVFKPQDQLSSALNKMFVSENRDAKYYTSVFEQLIR